MATPQASSAPLLEVHGLTKQFRVSRRQGIRTRREVVRAVDGISLNVSVGETVGLVGESGCGKTTAGRAIMRLIEPTAGTVRISGVDVGALKGEALRSTLRHMSFVFQDPFAALDPRMLIRDIVTEPLMAHGMITRREIPERSKSLLEAVGLRPEFAGRYPHEFSGGQRQRIGIARSIASDPKIVILDEPISALDISIRAQILNLLEELQSSKGLSYLFIAHDLSVVRHICDRVCVMYLGIIVEEGLSDTVFRTPKHPYTSALLDAIPIADPDVRKQRKLLEGDVPSPIDIPSGCRFRTRCPFAQEICARVIPVLKDYGNGNHAACHFPLNVAVSDQHIHA